jgi:DNA recombination protein RmuC
MCTLLALLAVASSAVAVYLFLLRARDAALIGQAREKAAALEATLAAERRGTEEKIALMEQSKAALSDSFAQLSRDALKENSEAFLGLAKTKLETVSAQAKGALELEKQAVAALVAPIAQSLAKVDGQIQSLEKNRVGAYATLGQQVAGLLTAQQKLEAETSKLAGALRSSNVRGNWGQLQLRRVLEAANLSDHYDFEEQLTLGSGNRPDVVIHLAGGRDIAVDAKAPMQAFLDAQDAADEETRNVKLRAHAQQLRARVNELSDKEYWTQLPRSLDLVVLFVPSEGLFQSALQFDGTLLEDAFAKKVVFATPLTLLALLRAAALGWKEETIAENARKISEQGKELYERMRGLADHVAKIGAGLGRAVEAYNQSVGSLERKVLPAARKMKELGAGGEEKIPPLERVETVVRPIVAAELAPSAHS